MSTASLKDGVDVASCMEGLLLEVGNLSCLRDDTAQDMEFFQVDDAEFVFTTGRQMDGLRDRAAEGPGCFHLVLPHILGNADPVGALFDYTLDFNCEIQGTVEYVLSGIISDQDLLNFAVYSHSD